jgi:hypothetical protein
MQYWRLKLNPKKHGNNVYYKSLINLSKINVPREAVADGDLLNIFLPDVEQVEEIPAEVYYEYMDD